MQSLALFPCSYTDGARMIGELSNSLDLPVYTDAMLFGDVSEQFGVLGEELTAVIYGKDPTLRRHILRKEKYVNLLRCSLGALRTISPRRRLFYGLHTSLVSSHADRVLRILVFDDVNSRMRRAVQQEGLAEDTAVRHITEHDERVSGWTKFLFNKKAYDRSLYDLVIDYNNRDFFEASTLIADYYRSSAEFQSVRQLVEKTPFWAGECFPQPASRTKFFLKTRGESGLGTAL
ncbi:MAG: cytidylate kinase family protein [Desulforhopalus sp.]